MSNNSNILTIFFEEPTRELNIREVARILKIAPTTASKELKKLEKEGILKERKLKIFNFYKANLERDKYRDLKIHYNIRKIKDSGLLDALNKFYLKPAIVLFGSAASGLDTEISDFDIVIISENTKEFPETKKFEKKLNRKLQIFTVKHIKDIKNEHLINNIINGITIQGQIKWT